MGGRSTDAGQPVAARRHDARRRCSCRGNVMIEGLSQESDGRPRAAFPAGSWFPYRRSRRNASGRLYRAQGSLERTSSFRAARNISTIEVESVLYSPPRRARSRHRRAPRPDAKWGETAVRFFVTLEGRRPGDRGNEIHRPHFPRPGLGRNVKVPRTVVFGSLPKKPRPEKKFQKIRPARPRPRRCRKVRSLGLISGRARARSGGPSGPFSARSRSGDFVLI